MLRFLRRIVKLATLVGVVGAGVAALQQSRARATQSATAAADGWPEVPRRPAE